MTGQAGALLRHLGWSVVDVVEDGVNRARGRRPAEVPMPMLNGSQPESAQSVAARYRAQHPDTALRTSTRRAQREDVRSER